MSMKTKAVTVAAVAALVAPLEGLRQWAYYDPPGIPTACYGHTGPDVKFGIKYSIPQCKAWLEEDSLEALDIVDRCAPGAPESVRVAFASAVFNIGPRIACDPKNSTAARLLDRHEWKGACEQLPRWNRAMVAGQSVELPGLTKRRALEKNICLAGLG